MRATGRLAWGWWGIPVEVESDDEDVLEILRVCYAAFDDRPQAGEPVSTRCRRAGDGVEIEVDGVPAAPAPDALTAVRTINHALAHAVMRRGRDRFYVHAGVVEAGGRAIVLPGLSRSGKSTLTLALARAGARLLSDELLAFDPERMRILGSPRAIKVRDECVGYFRDLEHHFVGGGESRFLPPDVLGPPLAELPLPLAAVVTPRWDGTAETRLTPQSPGRALLAMTASALNFGAHRTASLDHLTRLIEGASGWELRWADPHAAARLVLDEILP